MPIRVAALLACVTMAGCASSEVGFGTPLQPSPGAFPGRRETITGVVSVRDNGCVDLELGDEGLR